MLLLVCVCRRRSPDFRPLDSSAASDGYKRQMAAKSTGIVSDETIVSNHPCVEDVNVELERLKKQEDTQNEYDDLIPNYQDGVIDET
ncbi:phage portal protein, partial [Escherichia coli]|uniref:phage portal protein n=1 Tax=Escherichia coli TaxID=562 RepID=UPI001BC846A7